MSAGDVVGFVYCNLLRPFLKPVSLLSPSPSITVTVNFGINKEFMACVVFIHFPFLRLNLIDLGF